MATSKTMTPEISPLLGSILRGATALNNIAMSLLELHCYRQAHFALKDAVSVLRYVIDVDTTESLAPPTSKQAIAADMEEKIKRASQHLSNPKPCSHHLLLRILNDDDESLSMLDASTFRVAFAHLVRIVNPDFLKSGQDPILAVVSYNYGLSFLIQAKLSQSSLRALKLRENSIKIFRVATNFISLSANHEEDLPERTLFVAVLTLQSLFQTLQRAGQLAEAGRRLRSLKHASQKLNAVLSLRKACNSSSSFNVAVAA